MSNLTGQRGELGMTITVKRKATGKEETYHLTSVVEGDDAVKAQRIVKELNPIKESEDGGNALDSK
jgi:hypothetical protein